MEDRYLCSHCPKSFTEERMLKMHQRYHIKDPFTCTVCDKTFLSKQLFKTHFSQHKEEVYSCEVCFKTFKHKSNLVAHQRLHNSKYECIYCYKKFHRKDRLESHLSNCDKAVIDDLQSFEEKTSIFIKSTSEIKEENVTVDCNDNSENLENENFNYDSKNPCPICDSQVAHLSKHMETHMNNESSIEQCHICDKKFTLKNISNNI